jgi:tetratricopeptide (TPR) repeat protein
LSNGTPSANLLSGSLIDETLTRSDTNGSTALLTDAQRSTIALADASGVVQTSYTFEPFGHTEVSGNPSANDAQFTSRENDGLGLYYYRAAERIVARRYARSQKPDQLERALSRIYEKAGNLEDAEQRLKRAVTMGSSTPDNYLFLGQFFARHNRPVDAIRAFEQALSVAHDRPADLEFTQKRIEELSRAI